ncbi:MAG TPA: hypothetical protein VJ890_12465 [Vineibacter sp.]|nr:hypothetical protein [Vineibacter sp.]
MANVMKFEARTPAGTTIEFAFPLHPETVSVDTVAALVQTIMTQIDAEARKHPKLASSDVLQALAIALSARASMNEAPTERTTQLAKGLLAAALTAAGKTKRRNTTRSGTA